MARDNGWAIVMGNGTREWLVDIVPTEKDAEAMILQLTNGTYEHRHINRWYSKNDGKYIKYHYVRKDIWYVH